MKTYVVYQGDSVIAVGTRRECAELLWVKPETIRFYATPSARRGNRVAKVVMGE